MARPRTTTDQKELKGTAQPCRMNPSEPKPQRGLPECPLHLDEQHRAAWAEIVTIMDAMRTVRITDGWRWSQRLVLSRSCDGIGRPSPKRATPTRPNPNREQC